MGRPLLADEFLPFVLFLPDIDHHHLDIHVVQVTSKLLERFELFLALLAIDEMEEDERAVMTFVVQRFLLAPPVLQFEIGGFGPGGIEACFRQRQDRAVHEFR